MWASTGNWNGIGQGARTLPATAFRNGRWGRCPISTPSSFNIPGEASQPNRRAQAVIPITFTRPLPGRAA